MKAEPREVLLVEDDPDDVAFLRESLKGGPGLIRLKVAADGGGGLAALRGPGRPALVLLDWRLPDMSGLDLLREIRADAAIRHVPVLVLTTSASERDRRDAYAAGANCFLTKPTGLDAMRALARALEGFWLVHADLPK